jgi:hypothetical protein
MLAAFAGNRPRGILPPLHSLAVSLSFPLSSLFLLFFFFYAHIFLIFFFLVKISIWFHILKGAQGGSCIARREDTCSIWKYRPKSGCKSSRLSNADINTIIQPTHDSQSSRFFAHLSSYDSYAAYMKLFWCRVYTSYTQLQNMDQSNG